MSWRQGDGYRTYTPPGFGEYSKRLTKKRYALQALEQKWYKCGNGWILAEAMNIIDNPNGWMKWNGWQIKKRRYVITVFPAASIQIVDGHPDVVRGGASVLVKIVYDDKDAADRLFKEAQALARTL